jgi:uncharacterized RDD family membrane protein YckC
MNDEVRTPLRPAHPWSRFAALGVDLMIGMSATLIALMAGTRRGLPELGRLGQLTPEELAVEFPSLLVGVTLAFIVLALLPLISAFSLSRSGVTPGKSMMKLSVRGLEDGRFPTLGNAVAREYLKALVLLPALIPVASMMLPVVVLIVTFDLMRNPLARTFYDRLARTLVVTPAPAD